MPLITMYRGDDAVGVNTDNVETYANFLAHGWTEKPAEKEKEVEAAERPDEPDEKTTKPKSRRVK